MAIVKTLIVKGVARFLTDAYMSTIRSGIWNGSTIQVGYGGTGVTSAKGDQYTPVFLSSSGIAPCSVAIPHNTKDFKINGTTYSIFTTYTGTAPTIFAPTALAGTGGYILATNSAKTGLEWVAKPATNVTTSAVVASSATGTTQITAAQSDPYYNLLEGGAVARSIQFKHGDDLSISSSTDGIITFSLPTRLKSLITTDTGTTIFNGFGRITSGGPFEGFHDSAKDCMIISTGYNTSWGGQLATDYRTSNISYRAYNNGTWTDWALMASNKNTVNNNITVNWNSETTIATIAGIPIKIKIPANPDRRKAFHGTCTTAAATAAKVVTLSDATGWVLVAGTIIGVKFTNDNTASSVTLNVNNSGAKSIFYDNAVYTGTSKDVCGKTNRITYYMYDGTNWAWLGSGYVINTTYSTMSLDEITTGTATSQRVMTAKIINDWLHTKNHTVSGTWTHGNKIILDASNIITSNTLTDTSGVGLLFYNGGNMIGAFGDGTTATIPTYIRSTGNNLYHRKGKDGAFTDYLIADAGNIVNDNISVSWNTETTIATIAGVPIKIKIPSNPNTWRPIRVNNGTSNSVETATNTKAMNFASSNLNITYLAAGTNTNQSGNADYFTIKLDAKNWTGATSETAGTAGYMPGAASADRTKFLRGDGSWIALAPSISAGTSDTNKVKITVGGENSSEFTVPYATNADTVDGYHGTEFITKIPERNFSSSGTAPYDYVWLCRIGNTQGYSGLNVIIRIASRYDNVIFANLHIATGQYAYNSSSIRGYVLGHTYNASLYYIRTANDSSIGYDYYDIYAKVSAWNSFSWDIFKTDHNRNLFIEYKTQLLSALPAGSTQIAEYKPSYAGTSDHTPWSGLTGSGTTANQVIASTGVADQWNLRTLGEIAFNSIDQIAKVSKSLKVDTWTSMKTINGLSAGTYVIQISSGNVYASGVFTACGGTDSVIDEIPLHVSDKGTNTWRPYARISNNDLQMTTSEQTGTSREYTIKILKLI